MTLKTTDCLVGVRSLADERVSMVLTDPPYFLDGMGDNWDDKTLQNKKSKAKVIGGLPVGMCYDREQSRKLRSFIGPLAHEWMRVTKAGGFILCFSQPRLSHACATAMEDAGIEIRDLLAWKRHGQAKAFSQDHFIRKRKDLTSEEKNDMIKQLGGRKTPQLRPEMEIIILGQKPREGTFVNNWLKHRTGLINILDPLVEPDKFPSTLLPVPKERDNYGHPTGKPVKLLRHLIRIFGGENPVVLDPFAGCGSTGAACVLEGCSFIGFERDSSYANRGRKRIRDVKKRAESR